MKFAALATLFASTDARMKKNFGQVCDSAYQYTFCASPYSCCTAQPPRFSISNTSIFSAGSSVSNGPPTSICLPLTSQCTTTAPTADPGGCVKATGTNMQSYFYVVYSATANTADLSMNFGPGKPNTNGWTYTCPLEGATALIPTVATALMSIYMATS